MIKRPLRCVSMSALIAIAGCAGVHDTEQKIDQAIASVGAMKALAERNATNNAVIRTSRPRLAGEEVILKTKSLPPIFYKPASYVTKGSQALAEVLEDISLITGVQIKGREIGQAQGAPGQFNSGPPQTRITGNVSIDYNGTVHGLLDEIANKTNSSWRFTEPDGPVEFYRFETRTLSIYLPSGSKTIAASISLAGVSGGGSGSGSGAGGGGGSSAGNVSVSQGMTINPWSSVMEGIGTILSEGGAAPGQGSAPGGANGGGNVVSVSGVNGSAIAIPDLGLVTVTARPSAMERVAHYVNSVNRRFAQNVLIDVKIFSVSLDQQSSLGFNLNLLYNQIGRYGGSIVGSPPMQPATGTPGILTISSNNPNSPWNGSNLVAQALSQFGNVSLQTQGQVIAVNGQPAPIQVANEINYLASSSTTTTANVGTTTSLIPGTKVVGFTANFVPLILGDNRILLQYQLQISQLIGLTQTTSGGSSIQTPQISSQSLQQQAFVRDGQAIVLFGFDQNRDALDSALSIGSVSKAAHNERQMIVIVMQVNGGAKNGEI